MLIKETGLYRIPATVLKLCAKILEYPVSYLVSLTITKNTFLDYLKHANFCPTHKAGSKQKVENYHSISKLPALSKSFERAMFNRLQNSLKNENVLYRKPFGLQRKRSTKYALIKITESIRFVQNKFTYYILLHIKKAFDTIDLYKPLKKLSEDGVRGVALECFNCYLTNRTHSVELGDCLPQVVVIIFAVPQGSV